MEITDLIRKRDELRTEWYDIRSRRLFIKKEFRLIKNSDEPAIRRSEYCLLKKKQRHLSKKIKHLEKIINRGINVEKHG